MHFPVEVLQCTFAFACTDGGPTAANISLVSHIFHDAVLPMRFHSVALRTARSPAAFWAAYHDQIAAVKERGSGLKPVVRHLFVSCGIGSAADPIREGLVGRVLNIIALAAPTLETFACTGQLICTNFLIEHMCNQPLPVLRELFTTRASRLGYQSRGDGPEVPKMPALRKLVLLMASPYVYPMLDMTAWKAYAPNVTEIRLWNVDETCCALAWLELMTGRDKEERHYPSVERIILELCHLRYLEAAQSAPPQWVTELENYRGLPRDISISILRALVTMTRTKEHCERRWWLARLEKQWMCSVERSCPYGFA